MLPQRALSRRPRRDLALELPAQLPVRRSRSIDGSCLRMRRPPPLGRATGSVVRYCCPRSGEAPPSGVGAVPGELFPENRLLPKVPVTPEIAVPLNAISLFDSRTAALPSMPVALWLMLELLTIICEPGSPSMPVIVLPDITERLITTVLPVATAK